MQARIGDNVALTAGILSVVSLVIVFAAALQAIPTALIPRAPDAVLDAIPTLNAVVSLAAIGTITAGVRAIRRGDVERHRKLMGTSFALFVGFLAMYLYRVTLIGPASFAGPDAIEQFVYYPVLAIHILLAIASLPPVYYALVLALTRPASALPSTNHARVGRVAAALWLISFALGIVVYLLLHVLF
ncbi:putative membrane protein [Natronoarchaeum philippinense]|uniref:Putative membrane protein n=1 Tax=Natronoarchaeum philippinense TaxID=558529 RepID=A0A285NAH7_NATPI|nr:DUF420 domain-containing protein [Natronoarchaeum philippinense]SNZ04671.1 putative membrane protein [Natronoarchaeum philippinense]